MNNYENEEMGEKMNKRIVLYLLGFCTLMMVSFTWIFFNQKESLVETNKLTATVISASDDQITMQDHNNIIYTFSNKNVNADVGSSIVIEYSGILDKNMEIQESNIVSYIPSTQATDENGIPITWLDNGIFSKYYILANNKLKTLSLDEKIGQLFLVRYPGTNAKEALQTYQFGGYLFFEEDFKDKTETEVKNMINELQEISKIPLLTAVDEEGGKVIRISSNPNLVDSPFPSSQQLYSSGGFAMITQDTITKSRILSNLGLNLNLAPVVDVSTNSNDYIYERSFGKSTELTSTYAKTVIEASKGNDVSYTLKHFPGYGNNSDTHDNNSIDNRTLEDIVKYDLPPFEAGIQAGAEAVLISHNTVVNIDKDNPASLSASVHNLLRNDLNFTGIIMTDNLDMGAISNINDATVKAILAGNDLIITTDYKTSIEAVKQALYNGTISEDLINKLAFRVIAWKYYKGLMYDNQK